MKKKLLITGIEGTIGRILREALSGYEIYGVDIKDSHFPKYFKVDISDYPMLEEVFREVMPDYVVHLAADPRVHAPWESVLKNNIIGTRNIYECAKKFGVKKIVFASSNHVTGCYENPELYSKENPRKITVYDPIRPDGDYAVSKVFGEALAREYFELYGISSICLRIGAVLRDNDPPRDKRLMKIWLSHNDLIQLVEKSLSSDVKFGIYYGISNNRGSFLDISNARRELGYEPQDDAFQMA
ncbi:MAG TPA: NAD(P)-dependent oxidoreductase [candidate division WOR-3 bacterium]|uniref:NAD(P)-dependent oxidoreductase n=1 Tax=candidate division WOR-3 bacterium TaxID=2052148 RepID=A0A7V0Q7B2_UNCW3|nr:NAD(P)-dependent oxidoreductase [candidate division WOR-3 bacterium]